MCLTVPGRIVAIETSSDGPRVARVDFGQVVRPANLVFLPEVAVGDYVTVQAGIALRRLEPEEAREAVALHAELSELARQPAAAVPTARGR